MTNILIVNHCAHNKGDNGVLSNLIKLLQIHQKESITVSTSNGKSPFWKRLKTIHWPGGNIFREPNASNLQNGFRKINFLIQRKILYKILVMSYALSNNKDFLRQLASLLYPSFSKTTIDCDIVICTGGHHISNVLEKDAINPQLISLIIADVFEKPIILWAQTIGPFDGVSDTSNSAIAKILNRCKKIFVRDDPSINTLKLLKISNYTRSPDSVFLSNNHGQKENTSIEPKERKITIAVYTAGIKNQEYLERYRLSWIKIINSLTLMGNSVQLLPMQYKGYGGDERNFLHKIKCETSDKVQVLDSDLSPDETTQIFKESKLIIGHKTHSILYALALEVPVIGISYHPKTDSFMNEFGFAKYTFPDVIGNEVEIVNSTTQDHLNYQIEMYNSGLSREYKKRLLNNFESFINCLKF